MKFCCCQYLCLLLCLFPGQLLADGIADPVATGDWAVVLGRYIAVQESNPEDADARKGTWGAAMRLGLFEQAAAMSVELDSGERARMEGDRIALTIRHGRIDARLFTGKQRYLRLDEAVTATDKLATGFLAGHQIDAEEQRRLLDRVTALAASNRPAEAVALFEALKEKGAVVPAWVLRDVAGACLTLRQPERAAAMYRQVLQDLPGDFDASLGLFYAQVESEQLVEALEFIDLFAASLPMRRHLDGKANGERWSALVVSDLARLYADMLPEAQRRIDQRLDATPFNGEARMAEASLHLARGWTRQAVNELRRNEGMDPASVGLHADLAEALLRTGNWEEARAQLLFTQSLDESHPRLCQVEQSFSLRDSHELFVDAGYGHSETENPLGSTDWSVDSWLYGRPLADKWRVFLHNHAASAEFYGETTDWVRTGLGLEWHAGDWLMRGEVNGGDFEDPGVLLSLRWQPDDFWGFIARVESQTNEIPLQAVLAGVTARRAVAGVDWRAHEARRIALEVAAVDFSDDNQRQSVIVSWFERWWSGPRWSMETTLGVDASTNSLGYDAVYFNPPDDHSLWLTAAVEYLGWTDITTRAW